jgi:hypothetical protein
MSEAEKTNQFILRKAFPVVPSIPGKASRLDHRTAQAFVDPSLDLRAQPAQVEQFALEQVVRILKEHNSTNGRNISAQGVDVPVPFDQHVDR